MLRALDDPADTRRVAVVLSEDAYHVLNRARVAAARSAGKPTPTLSVFCGDLLAAIAASSDPVEIERRISGGVEGGGA